MLIGYIFSGASVGIQHRVWGWVSTVSDPKLGTGADPLLLLTVVLR